MWTTSESHPCDGVSLKAGIVKMTIVTTLMALTKFARFRCTGGRRWTTIRMEALGADFSGCRDRKIDMRMFGFICLICDVNQLFLCDCSIEDLRGNLVDGLPIGANLRTGRRSRSSGGLSRRRYCNRCGSGMLQALWRVLGVVAWWLVDSRRFTIIVIVESTDELFRLLCRSDTLSGKVKDGL